MIQYPKIQTLFKRDNKNVIIPNDFTLPEFEYLKDLKWSATEKIDGTNMSIQIRLIKNEESEELKVISGINGRTPNAQIPKLLENRMNEIISHVDFHEMFPTLIEGDSIVIFGEGYGKNIQSGGRYIKDSVDFILFDVLINGKWWLSREACEEIAEKLGIKIVPYIGEFTIQEAIQYVSAGFKSKISEDPELIAEGLVMHPIVELHSRSGERITCKIKFKDFEQYRRKTK